LCNLFRDPVGTVVKWFCDTERCLRCPSIPAKASGWIDFTLHDDNCKLAYKLKLKLTSRCKNSYDKIHHTIWIPWKSFGGIIPLESVTWLPFKYNNSSGWLGSEFKAASTLTNFWASTSWHWILSWLLEAGFVAHIHRDLISFGTSSSFWYQGQSSCDAKIGCQLTIWTSKIIVVRHVDKCKGICFLIFMLELSLAFLLCCIHFSAAATWNNWWRNPSEEQDEISTFLS